LKDISCCALATSRNDLFTIIVILIISMNIIGIITKNISEMLMMKRTSTFCFVKRDSQSSSFEQIEQDLPKSRHCKILLQAGPRPDKPEFTRKSIILKSSWIIAHFSFSLPKNVATPVPEFSFNIETSTVIGDFLDNYLRKWKKVAKHILRLWVSSICVLQWVWKKDFHRKRQDLQF